MNGCENASYHPRKVREHVRTPQRQVTVIEDRVGPLSTSKATSNAAIERVRKKPDAPTGRATYNKRIGTVEPAFGNIQIKDMHRFTLRGCAKVNALWQLLTIVHIEKIASACAVSGALQGPPLLGRSYLSLRDPLSVPKPAPLPALTQLAEDPKDKSW